MTELAIIVVGIAVIITNLNLIVHFERQRRAAERRARELSPPA